MTLIYRLEPLPDVWPGEETRDRKGSRFKIGFAKALLELERELGFLNATDVVLHVAVRGSKDINAAGTLRADARPQAPVILAFTSGKDRLTFPADQYDWWEDNVVAIARTLEALRAVDRHGVRQGRQYEGFKQLPSAGGTTASMTPWQAAVALAINAGDQFKMMDVMSDYGVAQRAFRAARARHHPDAPNGDRLAWDAIEAAAQRLAAHFGKRL